MKGRPEVITVTVVILFHSATVSAQLTNQGILDQVVAEFGTRAVAWQTVIMNSASWLFWTLGTISFTWTLGMLALKRADIGEFFAEFIRFVLFFGFFYWLLQNGPNFADSIIRSLRQLGDQAAGTSGLSPSGIVDIGFMLFQQAIQSLSILSPIDSAIGVVLSGIILVLLAVVAVNMVLLLIAAWVLMYAGIFFLGFGGSRWTSDMAVNYYKAVLSLAVQLFTMILLVGIGTDLLDAFYGKMSKGTINAEELGVMLVFCLALLLLVTKIPLLLAGIVTGGSGHLASGIGAFGAGPIAGTAAVGAGFAGAAAMSAVANVAGGASALTAAFQKAQQNASDGSGLFSGMPSGIGIANYSAPGETAAGTGARASTVAPSGSLAAAMGTAGRFAADVGVNLAQGAGQATKAKAAQMQQDFKDRVGETPGGKLAVAIRQPAGDAAPVAAPEASGPLEPDSGNLSDSADGDAEQDEVAAFVHKQPPAQAGG